MSNILPCPWCGNKKITVQEISEGIVFVSCEKCQAGIAPCKKEDFKDIWNTRLGGKENDTV